MLGITCLFLAILYLLASYYQILHYLLTLTIFVNFLILIKWSTKLPFKQVLKKIFFGQIFWSFMWILWILYHPNIFIWKKYFGYISHQLPNSATKTIANTSQIGNNRQNIQSIQNINKIIQNNQNQQLTSKLLQQNANSNSVFAQQFNQNDKNSSNQSNNLNHNMQKLFFSQYITPLILIPLLFHLPMMISNLGKLYACCTPSNKIDYSLLQEIIIFQSKLQLGIFFYCLLEILLNISTPNIEMIISVIVLGVILKAKYNVHFGTQKAYRQLHFAFDRVFKVLGLRNFYHFLYKIMSLGFLNLIQEKHISY